MAFNLYQEWNQKRLPIINGIIYEDGSIQRMIITDKNKGRSVELGSKLHLKTLKDAEELFLVEIDILCTKIDDENMITVSCGDGGYGGEGYVAIETLDHGKIKWIAFFEESNPFERVEVVDNLIYAYNNLNEEWIFEINNPTNIVICSI